MSTTLSTVEVRNGLAAMAVALIAQADKLNRLDAAIGDGDLGVTMRIGAQAVLDELQAQAGADLATLLTRTGLTFNRAAASTIGALIATAGMRAGKAAAAQHADAIDLPMLTRIVEAMEAGIRARGKAARGDKTLLDALIPVREALDLAVAEGASIEEAGDRVLAAAEAGRDETIAMRGATGRAGWIGDRTIGQTDPGAEVVVIAIRAVVCPKERS